MSKRPNVVSEDEKAAEAEIQRVRGERDGEMRAAMKAVEAGSAAAEPVVRSVSRGSVRHDMPPAVAAWIAAEDRAQMRHYRRISSAIAELAPLRDLWVEDFFARITGPRGYSVHAGTRRTIPEDQIPARPDRPWRLVW